MMAMVQIENSLKLEVIQVIRQAVNVSSQLLQTQVLVEQDS